MFWLTYFKAKLTKMKGVHVQEFGETLVEQDALNNIIDSLFSVSAKYYPEQYSHTFPKVETLHCFYYLCETANFDEMKYADIGYVYPEDKVSIKKTIGSSKTTYSLLITINNQRLKNMVLKFYKKHSKMPIAERFLKEDLEIVQEYMDYSADRLGYNLSGSTLHK